MRIARVGNGIIALLPMLLLTVFVSASCAYRPVDPGLWKAKRSFRDYYDTAFVFTDAGKSAPREMNAAQLADALRAYDVVFYGESHGHPGVHLQEMELFRHLYEGDPHWILSLEQFERDVQEVLNEYLAGHIGETALLDKGRAWTNYPTSYRPLLVFAKDHHLTVIAAEAPTWAVACVGQAGVEILDRFTPLERSWVAATIHTGPGEYRDNYMKFLAGSALHGGGKETAQDAGQRREREAERSFAAQATRDDTMAESIVLALQRHPGNKVLHLTGSFHSEKFLGTVERLRMREPGLKIAVIDPLEVDDPRAPAVRRDELAQATAVQLIYPDPPAFVAGEDMNSWAATMHSKRTPCRYTLSGNTS